MEEHFQNYVSDKKISDYYTQLHSQVIELSKEQNREFLDIFVKQNINIEKILYLIQNKFTLNRKLTIVTLSFNWVKGNI